MPIGWAPARGVPGTRPLPDEPPPPGHWNDMLNLHQVSIVTMHLGGRPELSDRWRTRHPVEHADRDVHCDL